ncbi:MAG: VCBS repeat-containing protein [Bacteroidota bacterium]|nr:VCBS repeat-containing protein [Bacteroidota bacterium]
MKRLTATLIFGILSSASAQSPQWSFTLPTNTDDRLFTCLAPWNYDADNRTELAACTYYYDISCPSLSGGYVYLLTINPLGALIRENNWISAYPACYHCLQWADVDGDLDTDLIVGTSLMTDENTPLLFFENESYSLNQTPSTLVSGKAWDVIDIAFGDFNYDGLPDVLVIRNDGLPYVLPGESSSSTAGWTLLGSSPVPLDISTFDSIPPQAYRTLDADIWDVNCDGFLDILLSTVNGTVELVSDSNLSMYRVPSLFGKCMYLSEASSYIPSCTDEGRVSILRGNAWDTGIATVIEVDSMQYFDLLPDGEDYNVEYVSDIELVSSSASLVSSVLVALAEAGNLDISDPRFRHGRILTLTQTSSGWDVSEVWSESSGARSEAFSVCWCDLSSSSPTQREIVLAGQDHLYSIGGAADQYSDFTPVYKIVSAHYHDGMAIVPIHCWFSGNGWFGVRESIPAGMSPHVMVQTFAQPDLFFGRRNCVEGYNR